MILSEMEETNRYGQVVLLDSGGDGGLFTAGCHFSVYSAVVTEDVNAGREKVRSLFRRSRYQLPYQAYYPALPIMHIIHIMPSLHQ
jgi:hypothetical protein